MKVDTTVKSGVTQGCGCGTNAVIHTRANGK